MIKPLHRLRFTEKIQLNTDIFAHIVKQIQLKFSCPRLNKKIYYRSKGPMHYDHVGEEAILKCGRE